MSGRLWATGVVVGSVALAVSCHPARVLRPASPTAVDATGRLSCGAEGPRGAAEPLIVDLPPEQRSDLELAMQRHVSVVAWNCTSLRVLPECWVDGAYDYQATGAKEQVVRLLDANSVRATLPLSGARLAGELGGDFATGTALDLALVMVGKRTTAQRGLTSDDLRGDCRAATHIVKSATLGAFTLATGARAQARSAAQLFGASAAVASQSGKVTFVRDGELQACSSDSPQVPPRQCDAALRLELLPIVQPEVPFVLITEADARGFRGKLCPDVGACQRRCEASDAQACSHLAILYAIADRVPRDLGQAGALNKRACELDYQDACSLLGIALLAEGPHVDVSRGRGYLNRACERGVHTACGALADSYRNAGDAASARAYAKRACDLGYADFCR